MVFDFFGYFFFGLLYLGDSVFDIFFEDLMGEYDEFFGGCRDLVGFVGESLFCYGDVFFVCEVVVLLDYLDDFFVLLVDVVVWVGIGDESSVGVGFDFGGLCLVGFLLSGWGFWWLLRIDFVGEDVGGVGGGGGLGWGLLGEVGFLGFGVVEVGV